MHPGHSSYVFMFVYILKSISLFNVSSFCVIITVLFLFSLSLSFWLVRVKRDLETWAIQATKSTRAYQGSSAGRFDLCFALLCFPECKRSASHCSSHSI